MRLSSAFAIVLALTASPAIARAQTNESTTIAESLFHDAQTHLAAGDIAAACDLFARSQRVEAALGTLLNLAACHERDGKTASAWTEFQGAISWAVRTGDGAREQYARAHASALEARLHRIVIEVLDPSEHTQIRLDGAPLPREALGTAIPLDPGEHAIDVTAPERAPWVRKINLGPSAGTDRIEVKLLPLSPALPEPAVVPPERGAEAKGSALEEHLAPLAGPPEPKPPWQFPPAAGSEPRPSAAPVPNGGRIAGYVAGGVGAAGVVAAIVLGVEMAQNTSDRDTLCPAGAPCGNQRAFADDHAARLDQQWMFVAGGVGIAALAAGAYLLLTSHGAARASARHGVDLDVAANPGAAGLHLHGSW